MKRFTQSLLAASLLALVPASAALAQNLVHLTFTRTGTTVGDVTVNVADENGQSLSGTVTATLESVAGSGNKSDLM